MSKYALLPYRKMNELDPFSAWERAFLGPMNGAWASVFNTDILDKGDHYLLEAELPGFDKKDIDIDIEGDQLVIKASHEQKSDEEGKNYVHRERRYGSFTRRFDINGIETEKISAAYENGVLRLTLPKIEEKKPEAKKISVN